MSGGTPTQARALATPDVGAPAIGRALAVLARVTAVPVVTGVLLALRAFFTAAVGPGVVFVRVTGLSRVVARRPYASIVASHALVACVAWPEAATWLATPAWRAALDVGLVLVAAGLCFEAGEVVHTAAPPRSLAALRVHVATRWPERWFAPRLANPLDAVFARLVVEQTLLVVPAFVLAIAPGTSGPATLAFFAVVQGVIGKRHETLAHSEIHYRPFASAHLHGRWERAVVRATELWVDYPLSVLCMRVPRWYGVQHITIHHAEDNGLEDTQSMLAYDRASYFDLCVAALRNGLSYVLPLDVIAYLRRRRRRRLLRHFLAGTALYYGALALIAVVSWPVAAFMVGWIFFAGGVGSAIHNLWWHAFVDPREPRNSYRSSMNLASDEQPLGSFGSDYHLEHHLHPERHWTLLHEDAMRRTDDPAYATEEAFVLVGSRRAFLRALWTRRFEDLADVLRPARPGTSRAEMAKLAEERTRPIIPRPARSAVAARLDALLGGAMARVVY